VKQTPSLQPDSPVGFGREAARPIVDYTAEVEVADAAGKTMTRAADFEVR